MSQADIEFVTEKRDKIKQQFVSMVPMKKTPEVFATRQQLKQRLTRLNRWIKELEALPK